MKQITRWTPDTHPDVSIDIEWDSDVPSEERVHTFKRFARKGDKWERPVPGADPVLVETGTEIQSPKEARFVALSDEQQYERILLENNTKNMVMGAILEEYDEITREREQDDGTMVKEFRPGMEPAWSLDEEGNVHIELKGAAADASTDRKNILLEAIDGDLQKLTSKDTIVVFID